MPLITRRFCGESEGISPAFSLGTALGSQPAADHVAAMKDNAILANAGHFDTEIDVGTLHAVAAKVTPRGADIERYTLHSGKSVDLLSGGRMVNLAVGGSRGN